MRDLLQTMIFHFQKSLFYWRIYKTAIAFLSVEDDLDLEDGQWEEIHVITGALKLFLRELPEPLFPFSFFDRFIAAIREYNCPVLENK